MAGQNLKSDKDIIVIAQRHRYLALLKKVKSGKALSGPELKELKKYDKKFKTNKKVIKKKTSGRPPISALRVRFLGLNCDNIIDADRFSGIRTPMAGIVEKYPQLKEVFERGQFLRILKRSAEDGNSIEEIAEQLGLGSVAKFKEAIKNDYEARSIWNSMRKDRINPATPGKTKVKK